MNNLQEYDFLQARLVKAYPHLAKAINSQYSIMRASFVAGEFIGYFWPMYKRAVYNGFGISF